MTAGTTSGSGGLIASEGTLLDAHGVLLVDLDGVVYLGDRPIDGAASALGAAREAGVRLVFVTNNASRTPAAVADQLVEMGVATKPSEVMTSAVAAAGELKRRLPADAPVLVVGGVGVREALAEAGLRPVDNAADQPVAVLQGFAAEVGWTQLAEASVALRAGATWVATNTDLTLPSPRGPLPGNGSLVAALAAATGLTPEVIGKPEPALFKAALAAGGDRPLVVGDRLDTDIAGARAAELPSLLVLSGVSSPAELLAAEPGSRPDYLGRDLRALSIAHPAAQARNGVATCGPTRVSIVDSAVQVDSDETLAAKSSPDGLDPFRALCALAWSAEPAQSSDGLDEVYKTALDNLDLD